MIVLAPTISLVNQMPSVWQGVYTWLRENYREVHLVTMDIFGNIVCDGQIKIYLNDGDQMVYFNFNHDSTIVTIVIEHCPIEEERQKIELSAPDSLDKIRQILARQGYI